MKIKRIIFMLVFAIVITAIPILASVGNDSSQNVAPTLTFSVYGYGVVRVARTNGSPLTYGAILPSGTQVVFHAEESAPTGFRFVGWAVNGEPYTGPLSMSHTVTMAGDTHVVAFFDPPWETEESPRALIANVSISVVENGVINIGVPGHSNIQFEYYLTDDEIEFAITPPPGRRFDDRTVVTALNGLEVTFGPIVRHDGRMLLAITRPIDTNQAINAMSAAVNSTAQFTVSYNLAGGRLPASVPTTQNLAYNSVINELPVPNRDGYMFGGWTINDQLATTPIQVRSNLILTAMWVRVEAQATAEYDGDDNDDSDDYANYAPMQYAVNFNPAPGAFASNEPGMRIGSYGAVINVPNAPTRTGYTFDGWRLPNGNIHIGNQITIRGDITLTAIWVANPAASPSPTPTPTPTPAPGTGTRPNPQTSPLHISFMIFGIVITAGLASFGILVLANKHMTAAGQYRADTARFNREQRIMDLIDADLNKK